MIKHSLTSFGPALRHLTKDKVNMVFALIPILCGLALYIFAGSWMYGTAMENGRALIDEYVSQGTWGSVVYYIVATIMVVLLFFIINWTFVLVVSIFASPFNDLISARIEKNERGEAQLDMKESFSRMMMKLAGTIFNEIKKVLFIIFLSLMAFVLSYIPILTPVGIFLTIVLLAIEFLDFSWSRHEWKFSQCLGDLKSNLIGYALGAGFFFLLVSIPLVNLVVPSLATSFFTTLWLKNNESRS